MSSPSNDEEPPNRWNTSIGAADLGRGFYSNGQSRRLLISRGALSGRVNLLGWEDVEGSELERSVSLEIGQGIRELEG